MLAKRNCLPSAKVIVGPIAAIDRRFHSPFKRRILSDPDCPQRRPKVLHVVRLDRIFRSGMAVRCLATANSRWFSHSFAGPDGRILDNTAKEALK